jgi:single-strand DNA-binding protein
MASVNKVILLGNLGRDPETRFATEGGSQITSLSLATSRNYKNMKGERVEETEWHRVVFFGRQAEIASQYLRKGSSVYVEGRLRTRKYEKDGVTHWTTEIIGETLQLLGSRSSDAQPAAAPDEFETVARQQTSARNFSSAPSQAPASRGYSQAPAQQAPASAPAASSYDNFQEDDIPF